MPNRIEILNEIAEERPRAFPAKYPGKCVFSGVSFFVGERIRRVSCGYVLSEILNKLGDRPEESVSDVAERCGPLDADQLIAWLDEGYRVDVIGKTVSVSRIWHKKGGEYTNGFGYRAKTASPAQLRNRTRHSAFMIRFARKMEDSP